MGAGQHLGIGKPMANGAGAFVIAFTLMSAQTDDPQKIPFDPKSVDAAWNKVSAPVYTPPPAIDDKYAVMEYLSEMHALGKSSDEASVREFLSARDSVVTFYGLKNSGFAAVTTSESFLKLAPYIRETIDAAGLDFSNDYHLRLVGVTPSTVPGEEGYGAFRAFIEKLVARGHVKVPGPNLFPPRVS